VTNFIALFKMTPVPKNKHDTSLNFLYSYLKQFKLSDSLYLVSCINAAFKFGRSELSDVDIPPYIKLWLGRLPKDKRTYLQINLDAARVARFLLLSGANDYKNHTLKLEDETFQKAMHYVGQLYDEEIEPKDGEPGLASKIMGRISQWQFPLQADRQPIIARAYLLYHIIPKKISIGYDIETKMQQYFQIGAFEFMATGMALWLKTNGILDYELKIEINSLKKVVTRASLLRFLELSSGTPTDYKQLIRRQNWKDMKKAEDIYYLDPLAKIPAIKVGHSLKLRHGTYLVPNAKYLLDRASNGIFYLLADKEQELGKAAGKTKQNPFRIAFGKLYATYVSKHLEQGKVENTFIDFDKDLAPIHGQTIPDFALVKDGTCVLFEVKLNILKLETRTFFDDQALLKEAKDGSIKKSIQQLSDFRQAILNQSIVHPALKNIKRVIIFLVSFEDIFIANSSLLPILRNEYGIMAEDMQIGCISDIEAIGNTLYKKENFIENLVKKIDTPETIHNSPVTYFEQLSGTDNRILKDAFNNYMNHLSLGITV
jgi:hypothetical protein